VTYNPLDEAWAEGKILVISYTDYEILRDAIERTPERFYLSTLSPGGTIYAMDPDQIETLKGEERSFREGR
jgi:hypothetical protein